MAIAISQLFTYPVKSCGALSHREVTVTRTGLQHDREWMAVDADGTFLSQRKFPQMVFIQPAFTDEHLVLTAPGMEPLLVPLTPVMGEILPVTVWESSCLGVDQGAVAASWFSAVLQTEARLVRQSPQHPRVLDLRYQRDDLSNDTSFADEFASLLASRASLQALNEHLEVPIGIDRFRPNIVVDGPSLEAWDEDSWRRARLGDNEIEVLKPCARCPIPDIDQATGERGTAVRAALRRLRKGKEHNREDAKPGIFFGQNISHKGPFPHTLRIGDTVDVLSSADSNITFA